MRTARAALWVTLGLIGCGEERTSPREREPQPASTGDAAKPKIEQADDAATPGAPIAPHAANVRFREDVIPVTRVEQALKGVFIPPYSTCVEPRDGERGSGPDGKVCINVAISGATEPGKSFAAYGSCDLVRTQRPYWPAPPTKQAAADDPRFEDDRYLAELAWVGAQIAATGCVCCHDSRVAPASQWDIALGPLWLDSLSDNGLALFAGLADSSVLGAYPPADNFGFDRERTGIPSTDSARMETFMREELARRGISERAARAVPPFGGPIYENRVRKPTSCGAGEGITPEGRVLWRGGDARYVYVLAEDSENPGVPPNLDLPEGTLWRLDVLASQPPVASGLAFGSTPEGSFQAFPERTPAASLRVGSRYQLTVLRDVGLPLANCTFEFGRALPGETSVPSDAGALALDASVAGDGAAGACSLPGGDAEGYGAPCRDGTNHSDCPCAANYCAIMPGQQQGYCTKTGCSGTSGCPDGWSCFDLSRFVPGQPAFCTR